MNYTQKVKDYLSDCDLRRAQGFVAAEAVGLGSYSTLDRRLKEEGSAFKELLDAERSSRCLALLERNPRVGFVLIAEKLGYAEPTSASRAFKRWFGISLSEFKRSRRQAA